MQEIKNQKKRSASQLPEHLQVCCVTHLNDSCHIFVFVVFEGVKLHVCFFHIWNSTVTYWDESCRKFECVMSHFWVSCVCHACRVRLKESSHSTQTKTSNTTHTETKCSALVLLEHLQVSRVMHLNESWCIFACESRASLPTIKQNSMRQIWALSHIQMRHVTRMNHSCRIWIRKYIIWMSPTVWRRPIGCLISGCLNIFLWVIFCKRAWA